MQIRQYFLDRHLVSIAHPLQSSIQLVFHFHQDFALVVPLPFYVCVFGSHLLVPPSKTTLPMQPLLFGIDLDQGQVTMPMQVVPLIRGRVFIRHNTKHLLKLVDEHAQRSYLRWGTTT